MTMRSESIIRELEHEAGQTRKMLQRVPMDEKDWKPHEKSMSLGRLATHVAELPRWITMTLTTKELDLMNPPWKTNKAGTTSELVALHDESMRMAVDALKSATDDAMMEKWSLRRGEQVFFSMPRISVIRTMSMNHIIHHRGQLSVFLRLLGVPVPGKYGPSADDNA
ncbi:MAG TPA: DinB family protein [Flavisolibacter sp.]|nr:DinB family protein [Flavisolibacter sp.]